MSRALEDELEQAQAAAARLVAVFRAQGAATRRVRLGVHARGPGVRRPAVPERYRLGKALYHRRTQLVGLRGPDGGLVQDPAMIDEALWRNRPGIWQLPMLRNLDKSNCFSVPGSPLGASWYQ